MHINQNLWAFGLLKQTFKRTEVGCLEDLVKVVEDSACVNHAQLVGKEDWEVIVKQYDWAKFFTPFFRRQAFDGIKSLHHLIFTSSKPGEVPVRKESDSEVVSTLILAKHHLHWNPSPQTLPEEITPPGLSRERRAYLFNKTGSLCPLRRGT